MSHRKLSVLAPLIALSLLLLACTSSSGTTPTPTATSEDRATGTPSGTASATSTVSPSATPGGSATATPAATVTATPVPEQPISNPQVDLSELEETLTALADAYTSPGEFAFAVTDIQTGETVGVNLDRKQLTGCSINFFILLQSTIDAQNGRVEEEAVGDLISATIRTSNPVTARELYRIAGDGDVIAGLERVAKLVDDLSGDGAIFDHPPLYAHESLDVDPNNYITAAAMNEALRAAYADGLLKREWLDYLLEKMTGVKDGLNYLLAVGPEVPVSHKNGFFPTDGGKWVDNDIGYVRFEQDGEERAYAVSFFSQFVPVKYGDVVLGQQLSTATWKFFQERYPSDDALAAEADTGADDEDSDS